ncbi:MAG: hypothetical protein AAF620_14725 [Bacteroidota bacterium]
MKNNKCKLTHTPGFFFQESMTSTFLDEDMKNLIENYSLSCSKCKYLPICGGNIQNKKFEKFPDFIDDFTKKCFEVGS